MTATYPTSFTDIIGNDEIKQQLERMLAKQEMGHALLFSGPEGVGKSLFAYAFAARLIQATTRGLLEEQVHKLSLGQHPDIHIYHPEGKLGLHSIQTMRLFSEEVYFPPFEAAWKVFIIHDASRMLTYSANALLKTFEEPPEKTLIILLGSSPTSFLPTIISRCTTLHFQAIADDESKAFLKKRYQFEEAIYDKIVRQARGSIRRAIHLAEQGDFIRTEVLNLLARGNLSDYRMLQKDIQGIVLRIETAKKEAEKKAKEESALVPFDQLSAHQQHAIEKELEGLSALTSAHEAHDLFLHILSWYRDLQLILLGGSLSYLSNPDYKQELEQAVQRGAFKPLEEVHKIIQQAQTSMQRSTPLALCLENVFLAIN